MVIGILTCQVRTWEGKTFKTFYFLEIHSHINWTNQTVTVARRPLVMPCSRPITDFANFFSPKLDGRDSLKSSAQCRQIRPGHLLKNIIAKKLKLCYVLCVCCSCSPHLCRHHKFNLQWELENLINFYYTVEMGTLNLTAQWIAH